MDKVKENLKHGIKVLKHQFLIFKQVYKNYPQIQFLLISLKELQIVVQMQSIQLTILQVPLDYLIPQQLDQVYSKAKTTAVRVHGIRPMRSSKRLMPLESLAVMCTSLFINKDSLVTFLNGVVVMHYSSAMNGRTGSFHSSKGCVT